MVSTISQLNYIWKNVLAKVKEKLVNDQHYYDSFFADTTLHAIEKDVFVVLVNSAVSKTFLQQTNQQGYLTLKKAVDEVLNQIII